MYALPPGPKAKEYPYRTHCTEIIPMIMSTMPSTLVTFFERAKPP